MNYLVPVELDMQNNAFLKILTAKIKFANVIL